MDVKKTKDKIIKEGLKTLVKVKEYTGEKAKIIPLEMDYITVVGIQDVKTFSDLNPHNIVIVATEVLDENDNKIRTEFYLGNRKEPFTILSLKQIEVKKSDMEKIVAIFLNYARVEITGPIWD